VNLLIEHIMVQDQDGENNNILFEATMFLFFLLFRVFVQMEWCKVPIDIIEFIAKKENTCKT
jgi:hypothetical protein